MSKSDLILFTNDDDKLPAHLQKLGGLGNENLTTADMAMPRINVLQQLSPQLSKSKPEFIAGAEAGQLYNTVTHEVSDALMVVNLYSQRSYVVFRKRELGGMDFQGEFETEATAKQHLLNIDKNPDHYDISETVNHYLLLLDDKGQVTSPAILSCQSTKLKVSRQWNTELRLLSDKYEVPRFGSVWKISTKSETNGRGQEYSNLVVDHVAWANEALAKRAQMEYEGIIREKVGAPADQTEAKEDAAA